MADDVSKLEKSETPSEAPNVPLTEKEFLAKLDDLIAAAQSAGLRHVPFMVTKHLARKGFSILEGVLDAVDEAYSKKGKG